MIPLMVKDADLDRIEVPEDYEILYATALGQEVELQAGHGARLPFEEELPPHTSPQPTSFLAQMTSVGCTLSLLDK